MVINIEVPSVPMEAIWLLVVIGAGISAAFTAKVAALKGYDETGWAIAGFFFGPIALISAAGLPDSRTRSYIRALAEKQGIEIEEVERKNRFDNLEDETGLGASGNTPGEDFDIVCRIYREKGGKGEPDFKASNMLARTISLKDVSGDSLAYFSQRGDRMWHLVNISK